MTAVSAGIEWFAILLISLVAVIVVTMVIVAVRTPRPWLVLTLLVFVGLPVLALSISRSSVFPVRVSYQTHMTKIAPSEASDPEFPASPAWLQADEHFLAADVYPSPTSGAFALTRLLLQQVEEVAAGHKRPQKIAVIHPNGADPLVTAAVNAIRAVDPPIDAKITNPGVTVIGVDVWVSLNSTADRESQSSGTVRVQLGGQEGNLVKSATFVHKPWVENFTAYVSTRLGEHFVLAQSISPATSAEEAQQQAIRDGARRIAPRIQAAVQRKGRPIVPVGEAQHRSIDLIAEDAIASGTMVADRFVQRFHRPAGDVYRALLLIRPEQAQIDQLASQYLRQSGDTRRQYLSLAGSVVILLVVLTALYLFLNAATKGYYAASIRVIVVVLGFAGLAALLIMA